MLPAEEHIEMFASNFLLVAINKNDVTTKLSSNYVTDKTTSEWQKKYFDKNFSIISDQYKQLGFQTQEKAFEENSLP